MNTCVLLLGGSFKSQGLAGSFLPALPVALALLWCLAFSEMLAAPLAGSWSEHDPEQSLQLTHAGHAGKKRMKMKALVAQSHPTLCDSMDGSPPGSSAHGILQARILEWVAVPSSRDSSQPRD